MQTSKLRIGLHGKLGCIVNLRSHKGIHLAAVLLSGPPHEVLHLPVELSHIEPGGMSLEHFGQNAQAPCIDKRIRERIDGLLMEKQSRSAFYDGFKRPTPTKSTCLRRHPDAYP